ncbi:CU044_5270 family protein [Kitasatospora sp. NPDC059463]|uniref:CU044_5270 family protein n=1 Tax=unclassified Kitasatospora TaxID=2633591 RepID=UPI0036B5473A
MNEDERAELDRLVPGPARPELSADRHRLLRGHLMSEIRETKPARARRGRLGWVALPALAGGLALALALTNGGGDGAPAPQQQARQAPQDAQAQPAPQQSAGTLNAAPVGAVQLLSQAADTAAGKPDPKPGKGQFVYVESLVAFGSSNIATGESKVDPAHRRQIWLSVDGSQWGVLKEGQGQGGKPNAPEKVKPGEPAPRADGGMWLDPNTRPGLNAPTYAYLATLPTDPDALLKKIYTETKGMGPGPDQEAFVTIGDVLREQIAPPAVSAALYRAAAKIPGVTVVDDSVDASGRHGVAVARVDGGIRTEWIFDPKTHEFLGERTVVAAEGNDFGKPGTVTGHSAVLASTVVDQPGVEPQQKNA